MGEYGALGVGEFGNKTIPTRVVISEKIVLRQISCGAMHTAFLTDCGEIFTCGSN